MESLLRSRKTWGVILLGIAALFQLSLVMNNFAVDWTKRVWRLRGLPAQERSGVIFLGSRPADYVEFIEASTPEDAILIIPPGSQWLSYQNVLLFYLLPRRATACDCSMSNRVDEQSSTCLQCLSTPDAYIPAIGDFPPPAAVGGKVFMPHEEDTGWFHGIYAPEGTAVSSVEQPPESGYSPLAVGLLDLAIWGAILLLGGILTIAILNRFDWPEVISLALPLGIGFLTWVVFLSSWAGFTLSIASFIAAFLMLATIAIVLIARNLRAGQQLDRIPALLVPRTRPFRRGDVLKLVLGGILSGLFFIAVLLAIGKAYSSFDPMVIWSLKGYGIAYEQTIFAYHRLGGHGLAYPLNVSLTATLFRIVDGDILPGSKALFPLFTISLLLGCYRFWRQRGVGFLLAALGIVLLFTVPLIYNHSTTGFANLPFTAYLVLGTLWSVEGLYENRAQSILMSGLLLAFAGWTRSEGLGFSIVIMAALIIARWISTKKLLPPLYWLVPIVLIPGLWSILGSQHMSGDEIGLVLRTFFDEALVGNVDLTNLGIILNYAWRQILTPNIWGILFFISAILLLLGIRYLEPRSHPENFALLLASLAAVAVPVGMMFVASATKFPLESWLVVSMDRALFPAVFLGTVLSILLGSLFLTRSDKAEAA